jgi:hypothetical protein
VNRERVGETPGGPPEVSARDGLLRETAELGDREVPQPLGLRIKLQQGVVLVAIPSSDDNCSRDLDRLPSLIATKSHELEKYWRVAKLDR